MREMHKWKDKVELSLDNRQIFFLFFGLSVVGCFVFALGVMVGRRVEFDPSSEVAALSADSLSMLDGHAEQEADLTFKEGLRESATDEIPPTRDPADVGKTAEELAALAVPAAVIAAPEPAAKKPATKAKNVTLASANQAAAKPKKKSASKSAPPPTSPTAVGQKFTLQMKAFAKAQEAEDFAAKLHAKGHKARVEAHEVKGRLWHRVRVGEFNTWAAGLAAKEKFESSEKTIAYVVRK